MTVAMPLTTRAVKIAIKDSWGALMTDKTEADRRERVLQIHEVLRAQDRQDLSTFLAAELAVDPVAHEVRGVKDGLNLMATEMRNMSEGIRSDLQQATTTRTTWNGISQTAVTLLALVIAGGAIGLTIVVQTGPINISSDDRLDVDMDADIDLDGAGSLAPDTEDTDFWKPTRMERAAP